MKRKLPAPGISYQAFWRGVTDDGREPCALSGNGLCDGPKDAHHYIPKRRIDQQLGGKNSPKAALAKLDVRNGVCLCRAHHDAVERRILSSPRPILLPFFLADHGLTEYEQLPAPTRRTR
jgi:hypothetical protein